MLTPCAESIYHNFLLLRLLPYRETPPTLPPPSLANCFLFLLTSLSLWIVSASPSEHMAHAIEAFLYVCLYFFIPCHSTQVNPKAKQDLENGA